MVFVEQEADGEIAHTLFQKRAVLRKLDGMDVAKLDFMAQHLAVYQPHQIFAHLPLLNGGKEEGERGERGKGEEEVTKGDGVMVGKREVMEARS